MDPIIGGAIVKGVGGLLGGLLGKKKAPSPAQNIESHMQGIRLGAEKYGFNPLAWAGTGAVTGSAPPNYMGAAIADATASIADAWSNKAFNNAQLDQLEMQNEKLRRDLTDATIRPTVPGLYSRVSYAPAPNRQGDGVAASADPSALGGVVNIEGLPLRPEWGEVLETGPGDLPTVVEGSLDDRPTEIGPVQNQPWFKEMQVGDNTVKVWNDEASDNEIASAVLLGTVPAQIVFKDLAENAKKFGGKPADEKGGLIDIFRWGEANLKNNLEPEWWKQQFGVTQ